MLLSAVFTEDGIAFFDMVKFLLRIHVDDDLVAKSHAAIIRYPFHRLKQGIERRARCCLVCRIASCRECLEYQSFVIKIVGSDVPIR